MIIVTIYYNTEADGTLVPEETALDDGPRCHVGPFETKKAADQWTNEDYPDGDTDVREIYRRVVRNSFSEYLNSPESLWSEAS